MISMGFSNIMRYDDIDSDIEIEVCGNKWLYEVDRLNEGEFNDGFMIRSYFEGRSDDIFVKRESMFLPIDVFSEMVGILNDNNVCADIDFKEELLELTDELRDCMEEVDGVKEVAKVSSMPFNRNSTIVKFYVEVEDDYGD